MGGWSELGLLLDTEGYFLPEEYDPGQELQTPDMVPKSVIFVGGPKDGENMMVAPGYMPFLTVMEMESPKTLLPKNYGAEVTAQTGLVDGPAFEHLKHMAELQDGPQTIQSKKHIYRLVPIAGNPIIGGVVHMYGEYEGLA